MAKIPFSKLGVKIDSEVAAMTWGEQIIEVRQYLPIKDKAEMLSKVINAASDTNGFYNPLRIKVFLTLETLYAYTNIGFTEKQKENTDKLYDSVISSGLFDKIVSLIPYEEWKDLQNTVWHTISNIYEYRNSVVGILDTITTNYDNTKLDIDVLAESLSNPETLTLLKDIMSQLG